MATTTRKTMTGLGGLLAGALLASVLVVGLNLDSWGLWLEAWGRRDARGENISGPEVSHPPTLYVSQRSADLKAWRRLPAHSEVDLVMLALTQALQALGAQVQSIEVVPDGVQPSPNNTREEGPQVLLSIKLLASYTQWVQWWETSRLEGVAWWPEQLTLVPAAGDSRLQIDGLWRVLLSDEPQATGAWTQDVHQWVPAAVAEPWNPFHLQTPQDNRQALVASDRQRCPKTSEAVALQHLRLVGMLKTRGKRTDQAVLQSGACQWVVRQGQRVGRHGHVVHSLDADATVWLVREGQAGGVRLKLRQKEKP